MQRYADNMGWVALLCRSEGAPGWIVFEVYPQKGKAPRNHSAEDRKAAHLNSTLIALPYPTETSI